MKKTKLYLSDIEREHPEKSYEELYDYVCELIHKGEITPVKQARMNGRKPALPAVYWRYEREKDYSQVFEELDFKLHPSIHTEYYRSHPDKYEKDAEKLWRLSGYLKNNGALLSVEETMNERSFEIFQREKFFQKEGGVKFCEKLGINKQTLNYYETSEPLSYYSHSKKFPQKILIIENKDTFYDIRRYLQNTDREILGAEFNTVIYGAGKGIWNAFADYANGAETYFTAGNELLYFGDIDYEGILIYEHLVKEGWLDISGESITIKPFVSGYERMLDKAEQLGFETMPDSKENQNTNIDRVFLDYFKEDRKAQMLKLLQMGKYIPQEIVNAHDWGLGKIQDREFDPGYKKWN